MSVINQHNLWFKAKWFGWGWTPVTWQGWLVTLVYLVLIILLSSTVDESSSNQEVLFMFVLPTTLLTITLIRIAYKKGEKPGWNWGKPKSNNDYPNSNSHSDNK
ncbi:hypothetical protein C4561_01285 [candidate division WWE3 bacterium]|uniref:Uncharacterized protein n=1 Tax=candidate division WWE3 bacterium TaxID=2053526 RepID=A0A3A4ZFJ3_UNCKA|nr:MAG: hypothetical protein C4561_01285 [candidate division WWE3 bacterium]